MRRLLLASAALATLTATAPGPSLMAAKPCTEYCGEKAAENCDDIDSFECGWYIVGCLAGCSISRL